MQEQHKMNNARKSKLVRDYEDIPTMVFKKKESKTLREAKTMNGKRLLRAAEVDSKLVQDRSKKNSCFHDLHLDSSKLARGWVLICEGSFDRICDNSTPFLTTIGVDPRCHLIHLSLCMVKGPEHTRMRIYPYWYIYIISHRADKWRKRTQLVFFNLHWCMPIFGANISKNSLILKIINPCNDKQY